jgi:4,5-DOPA dioxygenase extradiol
METKPMPVLFIGHGSPMNAIEDNEYNRTWRKIGQTIPRPKAILCISAHWETRGSLVTAMPKPKTIHDFYGFPRELNEMQYPATGSDWLVDQAIQAIKITDVQKDLNWGLDHGTWSVLAAMYPQADIPVVQLSLDRSHDADWQYKLGQGIQALRYEEVLILGSGNIVHNLRMAIFDDSIAYDWAVEYDGQVRDWILASDHESIIHYEKHGKLAALSVNSAEHYLPLLYVLGASKPGEPITFYNDKVMLGSMSMRCVQFG